MNIFKSLSIFIIIFFLTACSSTQPKVEKFFQTKNATLIKRDYKHIITLLRIYKTKLDKRNPKNYNKGNAYYINQEFANNRNTLFIKYQDKYIEDYNRYLKIALTTDKKINNRNDFLILGIYKYIWDAYSIKDGHKITTFSYNSEKLKSLYYALSILQWKIRTKKDMNNKYLFLTWQNNWQIEFEKNIQNNITPTWKSIQNLKYIKNGKESIYSHSNFNFEILMSKIIAYVENSIRITGDEPLDISIDAMKSFVFFL